VARDSVENARRKRTRCSRCVVEGAPGPSPGQRGTTSQSHTSSLAAAWARYGSTGSPSHCTPYTRKDSGTLCTVGPIVEDETWPT
jgi:hypothetical protein